MINIEECKQYKEQSGIYRITLLKDNRCYIGSSIDLGRRIRNHYTDLKSNIHKNQYLQRTWNKHGENSFIFDILEICNRLEVLDREQYWMDFYESFSTENGFNLAPVAGSTLGIKKSEEQIENFRKAIQGKHDTVLTQEQASEVKQLILDGKGLTEISEEFQVSYDAIRSIKKGDSFRYINPQIDHSLSMRAKLNEEDVIHIKKEINKGATVKELSTRYEVSHRTISAIKNEVNWKDVGEKITVKKRKSRNREKEVS